MTNQNMVFAYPFTSGVLNEIFVCESSKKLKKVFLELDALKYISKNWTIREFFENSYKQLLKSYRNEYVFKNAIAQKILIGRHSLKSSSMFSEFRVGSSKADIVIFNGTSHVYEIKTELDNLERLQTQINNYKKVFEFINVVTVESKIDAIASMLDDDVGIMILSKRYTLQLVRKAKSNKKYLDKKMIFSLLRRSEYLNIINGQYGFIPRVPNTKIYSECQKLFEQLPIEVIQKEFIKTLKNRKNHIQLINNIKEFPDSLKVAVVEANLSLSQQKHFLDLLNRKISTILT